MSLILEENVTILEKIQEELTQEINAIRDDTLRIASMILNREVTIQSLNGIIGGKNNTYVDSVRTQFLDFNDFFSQWIKGLNDTFTREKKIYQNWNGSFDWNDRASFKNVRLLQDEKIFLYTKKFLERNFYKYLSQRIRLKPDENLWSIWFGYQLTYGLLIAPEKTIQGWRIDKSEIRSATYNYWTIGHIMNTGFIVPEMDEATNFQDLPSFYNFYQSILKRLSKSVYEQKIYDMYIDYLKNSNAPFDEPFLIPEFRYAGLDKKHEYRIDFTVLNQYSEEFIGFEISPASSHMAVKDLKQKQGVVNEELKKSWEKEMAKRNQYFDRFGITIKTFTDSQLQDIGSCFEEIRLVLSNRPDNKTSLVSEIRRLNGF